tara:strand:+ start:2189 stop:2473 length:285 start_codon:yes stop_codon:yes gene_type:complete
MGKKEMFNRAYKQAITKSHSKEDISKLTGISKGILDEVFDRGLKAYESASAYIKKRVAPQQYAYGRLYGFAYGMKRGTPEYDTDLAVKVRRKNK